MKIIINFWCIIGILLNSTSYKKNDLNAEWKETLVFPGIHDPQAAFKVSVEDHHLITPTTELIGRVILRLGQAGTLKIWTLLQWFVIRDVFKYLILSNSVIENIDEFENKKPVTKIYSLNNKDGVPDGKDRGVRPTFSLII